MWFTVVHECEVCNEMQHCTMCWSAHSCSARVYMCLASTAVSIAPNKELVSTFICAM